MIWSYMSFEYLRNNRVKITKRVKDMDWRSSEVSIGGSDAGTEAMQVFKSAPSHSEKETGQGRDGY